MQDQGGEPARVPEDGELPPSSPGPDSPGGFARLARDSAIFAFGSVAGKVIGLLLLPIVTRLLVPSEFGRLDVLSTLATALTSVGVLGLDVAATRLYPDLDPNHRRRLFGTWTLIAFAVALSMAAVLGLTSPWISQRLFGTTAYALAVAMVGVYVIGNLFQVVGLTGLRNQRRPTAYAGVSTGAFVVNGVLVVVLLRWRPDVTSAMIAIAVGVLAGGLAAMFIGRHLVFGRPGRVEARALLRLGLPIVPALVATWIGDFVNRAVLLGAAGASEVGYLSVAVRFGAAGLLVVSGFQLAWHPQAFAMGQDPAALRRIALDARRIVIGVCATVVPLGLLAPELLRLVSGPDYGPALPALGLSLMVSIALALYMIATMPSAISQRMRDLGLSATIGAVATICLNIALARVAGSGGTATAMLLGQLIGVAVAIGLARNRAPVPFDWPRITVISTGAAIVIGISTLISGGTPFLLRLVVGLVFVGLLAIEGSLGEVSAFAGQVRRQFSRR